MRGRTSGDARLAASEGDIFQRGSSAGAYAGPSRQAGTSDARVRNRNVNVNLGLKPRGPAGREGEREGGRAR